MNWNPHEENDVIIIDQPEDDLDNQTKYPLELFLRVITVSQETNQIVANLPELDID